ncbi:MAG: glycosyltransferase family 2 protein [Pseudomonadota bacterium]
MTPPPSVSAIVVSHGRPQHLALCLSALCRQRHPRYEIIVVADTPPRWPDSDVPTQFHRFTARNISTARNLGLAQARGEVVAFIDDDAVPEYDWLDQITAPFAHPRVGSAGGWVRGARGWAWQSKTILVDPEGWDRDLTHSAQQPIIVPAMPSGVLKTTGTNCAFRTQPLRAIGGFDPGFAYFLEETDVNMRLAQAGWLSVSTPLAEVHHATAPGPHRTTLRVPRSLVEIGGSRGRFLAKHCPDRAFDRHLKRFSEDQTLRLDRFVALGLLEGAQRDQLLEQFQSAMAEGFQSDLSPLAPLDGPSATGVPLRERPTSPRHLLKTGDPALACDLVAAGAEVTRLSIGVWSLTKPKIGYSAAEGWHHRFPLTPTGRRLFQQEIARLTPRRGPWVT